MSLRGRPLCDDKSGEHHGVWGGVVDKLTNRNLFCDFRDVGSLEASAEILGSSSSLGTLSAGDDDLEIGMRLFCLLLCRHRLRDMMGQRDCCMQSVICPGTKPTDNTRTTGDLRALVVEDDPLNLMVIEKLLSMSGVTSIDVASNGAEVRDRVALRCTIIALLVLSGY